MTEKLNFSTEKMAGQRMMLGFDGVRLNSELKTLIQDLKVGGIILFKPNIESPDQLRQLCSDAQDFARDCGQPALFIAVDQEGGTVARLRHPFTEFPGNPHIHTREQAIEFARVTARELSDMGINMNMAPVLDVAPSGADSIMKERVFPGDHTLVSDLGSAMISTFQSQGVMAVAKHFPGIGRTIKDSHFFLPILDVDIETLKTNDIKPFEAARDSEVAGMMLSHISYPRLDSIWQASLSPAIARDLLRDQLGYNGLVLTDDMDMKAIGHDIETCMAQVLGADIDMALICHKGPSIKKAWSTILGLLDTNADLFTRGQVSAERIMTAKNRYLSFF